MSPEEYAASRALPYGGAPTVTVDEVGLNSRTLLYGYTLDRDTWHVYVDADTRLIHLCVYDHGWDADHPAAILRDEARPVWPAEDLMPSKRAYPESTDYVFARIMRDKGVSIPHTTYREDRWEKVRGLRFHGLTQGQTYEPGVS